MQISERLVRQAIDDAEAGRPVELPEIEGYSSYKERRLLNNLCSHDDATYFEIGVHKGSTFISALYGNEARGVCVDNWSMEGDKRAIFEENVLRWLPDRDIKLIVGDCFEVPFTEIPPVDVYFYDGDHTEWAQYMAFTHFNAALKSRFIAILDDFNWAGPRVGTFQAFRDLGYRIEAQWLLPGEEGDMTQWWNGLYVAVIDKG